MLACLCSPREHEEARSRTSSCVTAPFLIGESHAVRGRIRYHHQILNEIVPHMPVCYLLFSLLLPAAIFADD